MTTAGPFRIVVEPDGGAWRASCPALEKYGAAPGGTRDEALENIRQVIEMVVTDLAEAGLRSR